MKFLAVPEKISSRRSLSFDPNNLKFNKIRDNSEPSLFDGINDIRDTQISAFNIKKVNV